MRHSKLWDDSVGRDRRLNWAVFVSLRKQQHETKSLLVNMVKLAFNSALGQKDAKKEEKEEALIPQDVVSFVSAKHANVTKYKRRDFDNDVVFNHELFLYLMTEVRTYSWIA